MDQRLNIAEKVKEIVGNQLDVDKEKITETSSFVDDLGADSLDITEMIMAMEEELEVEVEDEEASNLKTVGDVIEFIENKKSS